MKQSNSSEYSKNILQSKEASVLKKGLSVTQKSVKLLVFVCEGKCSKFGYKMLYNKRFYAHHVN